MASRIFAKGSARDGGGVAARGGGFVREPQSTGGSLRRAVTAAIEGPPSPRAGRTYWTSTSALPNRGTSSATHRLRYQRQNGSPNHGPSSSRVPGKRRGSSSSGVSHRSGAKSSGSASAGASIFSGRPSTASSTHAQPDSVKDTATARNGAARGAIGPLTPA